MSMKTVMVFLFIVMSFLQYKLWFSGDGVPEAWNLNKDLNVQVAKNIELEERNLALEAEVRDLKNGNKAIEEHARTDLGMVKKNEVFYQVVSHAKHKKLQRRN